MMDFKTILLDILTAIGYSEDKEAFIEKFITNIELQSFVDLMQGLPKNKQEGLESQLSTISNNPQKASETLKPYFSEEQVQQSLQNVTNNAITSYITAISDTLSDVQRENLHRELDKYSSSQLTPTSL